MKRDDFYVGYLPMPPVFKRTLWVMVPLLVIGAVVLSFALASKQNNPGDGTWDLSHTTTYTGVLRMDPYPMLVVPEGDNGQTRDLLLVTMGKIGGQGLSLPEDGQTLSITGYPIARGGDTVLLSVEKPESDVTLQSGESAGWSPVSLGDTTLSGQIIDPKCYFGAMKPGEGKVHKACATLCIAGGIPPMFMTQDDAGERTYYLLLDTNGQGLTGERLKALLPFVADPVSLSGRLERVGNLLLFRIDPTKIKRL